MSVLDDEDMISHNCISHTVINGDVLVSLGFKYTHTVVKTSTILKSDYLPTDTEYDSYDFEALVDGDERKVKVYPYDGSFLAELFVNGFMMNIDRVKIVRDLNDFCKRYLNTTLI